MELEELKSLWIAQEKKLDKSLQLNLKLLREVNFDKAAGKLKPLIFFKIIEMAILWFMMIYLFSFTIDHITELSFSIPALLIAGFITSGVISGIRQLALIVQIQKDGDAPVAELQKKIGKLKLLIISYTRTSFISIPFYPLLLIVSAKIFFNADLWLPQYNVWLIVNGIVGLLFIPLFIWLYRQLSKPTIINPAVKSFLSGSGWNQATLAQQFLDEIEKFEQGE
jgi:hypothetical protein